MQAAARFRLLKDLVAANVLPNVALQSVAAQLFSPPCALRGVCRWQTFRYVIDSVVLGLARLYAQYRAKCSAGLALATWLAVLLSISPPGFTLRTNMLESLPRHTHHTR